MNTPRLNLPLIEAGQAHKEIVHNEALALIDLALHASVAGMAVNEPPANPHAGQAWVVGASPTAAWAGQAHAVAGWTAGGWRFVGPRAGLSVWSEADAAPARFDGTAWRAESPAPAIAAPSGGAVVDLEARATIAALLVMLREGRVIAGG